MQSKTLNLQALQNCIELAKLGESHCYPNPAVGAIVIYNGMTIGKGFHARYGESHAEPIAIKVAEDLLKGIYAKYQNQSDEPNPHLAKLIELASQFESAEEFQKHILSESTIYVSLEPCAHTGKTPPCADLIIKKGLKELVYICKDPNPKVAGQGIARVKAAGIEVTCLEEIETEGELQNKISQLIAEAKQLNRAWLKKIQKPGSTWITLKVALTVEGSMVTAPGEPKQITNSESQKAVHRMRSTHQAIVTGITTVLEDDCELTVRYPAQELGLAETKNPQRFVLKSLTRLNDELAGELKIFEQGFSYCRNSKELDGKTKICSIKTQEDGDHDFDTLKNFIAHLQTQGFSKVMVEAGPTLSQAFIKEALVDELVVLQPQSPNAKLPDWISKLPLEARREYQLTSQDQEDKCYHLLLS